MIGPVVFIGDDFTGASDSLATYARAGWSARLILNPDRPDLAQGRRVLGFPTALRAMTPQEAEAELARLWPAIARLEPEILHLKVCSTFDSSPTVGSIGAAVRALTARFSPARVAVIGGQPSLGRYCAFGTLFAAGPDGAVHRIDRHPVMRNHPVTPMQEADLARHLGAQGLADLSSVPAPDLVRTAENPDLLPQGPLLFDAIAAGDTGLIGRALSQTGGRQLVVGASSVAEALTCGASAAAAPSPVPPPRSDRVLIFAGSRSSLTRAQVAAAEGFTRLPVEPDQSGWPALVDAAIAALERDERVLVHLRPETDYGLSPALLARRSVDLVAAVLARVPVGRLGIAGGDTSSLICGALGFDALDYDGSLGLGVSICAALHPDPTHHGMRVMLKGGQMGSATLFEDFAKREW